MSDTERLLVEAKRQYEAGEFDEACASCRRLLEAEPENATALELLGVGASRRGNPAEAIDFLERASKLRPADTGLLANLGAVYRMAGQVDEAEARFRKALSLDPDAAPARFNLANLLTGRGALDEALREYASVLTRAPSHTGALNNMAALLKAQGHYAEAESAYRRLIAQAPQDATARSNFGALLMESGRTEAAISYYREAIELAPTAPEPRNNLGVALIAAGKFEEAVACLSEACALDPTNASIHENLGNALRKIGAVEGAAASYEKAIVLAGSGGARFKRATLLPAVAASREMLEEWHDGMAAAIGDLVRDPPVLRNPYAEVGVTTFNLSYHDTNNREVQATLARAYVKACPSLEFTAPHCAAVRAGRGRLRVGFVSRHFATNAVGWCFHGVLRHMPRDAMEVVAVRIGESGDPLWQSIAAHVDAAVVVPATLDTAREKIAALELDVLVYTDIGMEPLTYFLAFARLAPLQCVLGGHPDTLGIPAIDFYISSDLQEPADAANHYSEKLVRLPGAPTYYDRPDILAPLKPRSEFGLPNEAALYFCAQTLIKVHPNMDRLFAGILEADSEGLIILPAGYNPALVALLRNRIANSLGSKADRVRFLAAMSHADFMNVMALADVSLDTRPFGGGNTSWQAIAVGTPVVTWPGRFLRGRYTQALYRLMGVEDTVVDSAGAYVSTAVEMARNQPLRAEFVRRVEANSDRIFSDMAHVRALHDALLQLAGSRICA